MSIRSLAARGLSFAHLAGLSAKAAKAEDDEDKDKKNAKAEGDSDDEEKNQDRDDGDAKKAKSKAKAEDKDDDDDQSDDGQKSGKKAEDGDDTKDYAEDDDDKEKAEEDDDEDEEMRGKSAAARARRREQARCAAIMGHKAAGRNIVLAANLAFNTRMGRQEAIAVLSATPAASVPGQGRSARNPNLGSGGETHRSPAAEAGAGWSRAFSKVTGRRG